MDQIRYGITHLYREYEEIVSVHAYQEFLAEATDGEERAITRLILGHTHRQAVRYLLDNLLWLNPGSASYRRRDDPDQSAHYATIVDGTISLKQLHYDLEPLHIYVSQTELKEAEIAVAERFFCPR